MSSAPPSASSDCSDSENLRQQLSLLQHHVNNGMLSEARNNSCASQQNSIQNLLTGCGILVAGFGVLVAGITAILTAMLVTIGWIQINPQQYPDITNTTPAITSPPPVRSEDVLDFPHGLSSFTGSARDGNHTSEIYAFQPVVVPTQESHFPEINDEIMPVVVDSSINPVHESVNIERPNPTRTAEPAKTPEPIETEEIDDTDDSHHGSQQNTPEPPVYSTDEPEQDDD